MTEQRSEQQESLDGTPTRTTRQDDLAPQFTEPGGGPTDTEPDEVADDAGVHGAIGPEHAAVRVEEGEEGSGRTGDATSGYLDPE
ncbi:hypothetical protein ACFQV2_17680 [Actinokineospora soli]|uniref:DUF5709 domain-containing protein n=1 Tax=Actinokineospora soli TaxID=1048753 RepID=A0ABW2TQM1_9PSEU